MKRLGYGEPQTVWQGFKAFLKDILGFNKSSVLDKALDPLTDIVETGAKYRRDTKMSLEDYGVFGDPTRSYDAALVVALLVVEY